MEHFFYKKYCFAAVFLIFVLGFSMVNMIYGKEMLADLGKDFKEIDSISDVKAWVSEVEAEAGEEILGKMQYVEAYGFLQKILNKREFNQFSYVQDYDGMLYYGAVTEIETDDIGGYVENVKRMNDYVESSGGKLLVVIPPSKVLAGVSTINTSWPVNNPNNRMDKIMNLFQQNGINAVDLRWSMQESGAALDDLFFKTDHHWTPLAAFYGTAEVVRQVTRRFGDNWDPGGYYTDLSNYSSYTYSQCFLGSTGRNTGAVYGSLDDYTMMWPQCDDEFIWTNYEDNKETRGSFTEALMKKSVLMDIDDIYKSNINRVYLDQVVDQDKIVNLSNPDGPRLTVLRDSYFTPMACFLAPMCSEINMLWTRSGIDMEDFIRESEFDYVILEIYPYNLDEVSFDFFHETAE